MKIVVDTNRIIASMIKDSISKKILFNKSFEFVCPDYSLVEINKYKEEIISKANIKHEEFEIYYYPIKHTHFNLTKFVLFI